MAHHHRAAWSCILCAQCLVRLVSPTTANSQLEELHRQRGPWDHLLNTEHNAVFPEFGQSCEKTNSCPSENCCLISIHCISLRLAMCSCKPQLAQPCNSVETVWAKGLCLSRQQQESQTPNAVKLSLWHAAAFKPRRSAVAQCTPVNPANMTDINVWLLFR